MKSSFCDYSTGATEVAVLFRDKSDRYWREKKGSPRTSEKYAQISSVVEMKAMSVECFGSKQETGNE